MSLAVSARREPAVDRAPACWPPSSGSASWRRARARLPMCRCHAPARRRRHALDVWLSPQTIVVPGRRSLLGRRYARSPGGGRARCNIDAELPGVDRKLLDLRAALGVLDRQRAVGGRHVMVDDRQRALGGAQLPAGGAQPLEGLRARDLVNEMAVDVEEAGAVLLAVNDVIVEDLVVASCAARWKPLTFCGISPQGGLGPFVSKRIYAPGAISQSLWAPFLGWASSLVETTPGLSPKTPYGEDKSREAS